MRSEKDLGQQENASQAYTDVELNELMEAELEQALKNFRLNMHAWSDAAYGRRHVLAVVPRRRVWRLAASWALACTLLAGGVSTGIHMQHEKRAEQMARLAAAREAEHERLMADMRAQEAENLLANVDKDVSREVPSALEPLADLMNVDSAQ